MFERFTADARVAIVDAQGHALRLGHDYIGCEHLLLAVASGETEVRDVLHHAGLTSAAVEAAARRLLGTTGEAIDRDALAAIGIDLDLVRSKIEAAFGPGALRPSSAPRRRWRRRSSCEPRPGRIPFTPRAKRCLELSLREALALGDGHVGAEHIALALTTIRDGVAPRIFSMIGVSPEQVRAQVLDRYRRAG